MSTYRPDKPTRRYSNEYKVSAVRMTFKPGVMIKDVAASLDIPSLHAVPLAQRVFRGQSCGERTQSIRTPEANSQAKRAH